MSIATESARIIAAKAAIKSAIEQAGIDVSSELKLQGYPDKVAEIQSGADGFLDVESITLPTSASTTANYAYNKQLLILDSDGVAWDLKEWHQRWVDNNYTIDASWATPVGIKMHVFGKWRSYLWPLEESVPMTDVTGNAGTTTTGYRLAPFDENAITSARSGGAYPAAQGTIETGETRTAGSYYDKEWSATNNGDGLDLYSANTKETFFQKSRNVGNSNAFQDDDPEAYTDNFYKQNELCRAMFAICSGLTTTEANGATATVEILNASGEQAAVGEDMYFWIGGVNTGLKAKYNLTSRPINSPNAYNVTTTIQDAIYAAQVANGINMNDTGVNSGSLHTLGQGAKGAEAIAVEGYWYIKTPVLWRPSATTLDSTYNIPDSPAAYACVANNAHLHTTDSLVAYWKNRTRHITKVRELLTTEGYTISSIPSGTSWSAIRYYAAHFWYVYVGVGVVSYGSGFYRYSVVPCPLPSAAL